MYRFLWWVTFTVYILTSTGGSQYVRGVLDRRPRNVVSIGQLVDVIAEAVEVRLRVYFNVLDTILENHTGLVEHRLIADLTRMEAKLDNQTSLLTKPQDYVSPMLKDQFNKLEEKIDNYTFLLAEPLLKQQKKNQDAEKRFLDCTSVARDNRYATSGIYWINIPGVKERKAFCTIQAGSGWTVIMQRSDGSVNFNRPWNDYKNGFGNVDGEYWIGNEVIHRLTHNRTALIRIVMKSMWILGGEAHSLYRQFRIGNESSGYKLFIGGYDNSSTGGDSMTSTTEYCKEPSNNGSKFSTNDRENNPSNCSTELSGGWWFSDCGCSNLNGQYISGGSVISDNKNVGVYWDSVYRNLFGLKNSLRAVRMEIKPADDRRE
ncbi:fibrinogen-like protein 1 isoform X2 [Octopus bimaculoides]|uniref:fibrinogen-like protein 1 isoform X2 n=1 Tax=Octopus bimaculoides TaxID=37653 RepID=UPI00071C9D69|nr:fibrinogen-like protein 1 isoform X2 [Octopus bimaculoides]|eukprot:XP_014768653.1 PREDICTED: fibrinogen-like protein 1 isoform X2 [Octopus bimaculoides]